MKKPRLPAPDLRVYWSKREKALMYYAPGPTGGVLSYHFEQTLTTQDVALTKLLEDRGYDLTTLRFSIRKNKP